MCRKIYKSEWEYIEEMLGLAEEKLRAYQGTTGLFEGSPPALEIKGYEERQEAFRERIRIMGEKGKLSAEQGIVISVEYLYRVFQADDFMKHCVTLSFAAELDGNFRKSCTFLEENQNYEYPTLQLCIHSYTLDRQERSRILRNVYRNRVRYEFFFGRTPSGKFASSGWALRLEERIRMFLFRMEGEAPELQGFCSLAFPREVKERPMLYQGELALRLAEFLRQDKSRERIYYLHGEEGTGKQFLVRHAFGELGKLCLFVQAGGLLGDENDMRLRQVLREAKLRQAGLCIRDFQEITKEWKEYEVGEMLEKCLRELPFVILLSTEKWPYSRKKLSEEFLEMSLPLPDIGKRIVLWKQALMEAGVKGADPEGLAVKFSFSPGKIKASAREAERLARWRGQPIDEEILYESCRMQISHKLGEKAACIEAAFTWEDLVLPDFQKMRLRNACDQITFYHRVYETWGFEKKLPYGRGVSMLFYGPPGTGKTMGAQVVARELHLELYKVDLSSVMSKYIGETEKNLDSIFEEVKKSRSILFFDEADALFGKRSEVKDAQDKYANAETAYLLQKIEEYEGIVILASNYLQNFDEAFKRRIKFMIEFPLPDRERRLEIWKRMYPKEAPVSEELDFAYLARQFELSGSSIKNIAVASAFLAASQETEIGMRQVLFALWEELKKSGKLLQREEFGEYQYIAEEIFLPDGKAAKVQRF